MVKCTRGASLQDLKLQGRLNNVETLLKNCTANYSPICVYCAIPVEPDPEADHYPQCHTCVRPHIINNVVFYFPSLPAS